MAQKLLMDGQPTWLKIYEKRSGTRVAATRLWNGIAQGLGAGILRAPPQHGIEQTRQIEMRRLNELRDQGVLVPDILAEGKGALVLSDIGPSLSGQLKAAGNDAQIDELVQAAVTAMAHAHRNGAYFGQAFARNITVCDQRIGFIDFEEDPLEVMSLADAQARDWLMFAAGVSRHYEKRSDVLTHMFRQVRPSLDDAVIARLCDSAERLGFVQRCTRRMGLRARAIGVAIGSVRHGFSLLLLGLLADVLLDGESDVFNLLRDIL